MDLNRRVFLAGSLLLSVVGARAQGSTSAEAAAIIEAARKEGKVVNWGATDSTSARQIQEAFASAYPEMEFEILQISPAAAVERMLTALAANKIEVDVFDGYTTSALSLAEKGLIEPFPWHEVFGIPQDQILMGGLCVKNWENDMPIMYNTELVKEGDITSWDDLLDPKWRGKILVEGRTPSLGILAYKWGKEKTFEFIDRLKENQPIITKGSTATVEALAAGQGSIAIESIGGLLRRAKRLGAPVDWFRVGPIAVHFSVFAPIKGAPHPNAAKLYTNLMTTDPTVQGILLENRGLSLSEARDALAGTNVEMVYEPEDKKLYQELVAAMSARLGAV